MDREEGILVIRRMWALMLVMLALSAAGGQGRAMAENEGVIVQSACNIVQSGEYYLVYCYAQVHNNSDQIICLEQGTFDLVNGEDLLATSEVSQIWPYFLNPGEDGYLFDIVSFEPDEYGNPVVPSVTGISYEIQYMTVDTAYASYGLDTEATLVTDASGAMSVVCRVTNNTQVDAYDPTVAFGLYTESGYMLYADGSTVQNVGIPAGGTLLMRFSVEDAFVSQWTSAGMMPTQTRVTASFRNDQD